MQVQSVAREDPLEKGNGNPLQHSCLGNPMDRGAWWATVQGLTQSGHNWATKQQQEEDFRNTASRPHLQSFCYNCSGGVPASVCCFFFFKTKTNGKGNKTSSHPGNSNLQSELETTALKHGLPMFAEEYRPSGPNFRFPPGLFPHIARVCVSVCPLPFPRQMMLSFCFWTLTAFFPYWKNSDYT